MKKALVIIVLFAMVSSGLVLAEKKSKEDIIKEKLENEKVSFNFDSTPLKTVIKKMSQKTDINMIIDPSASGDKIPITIKFEDMKLQTALQWVMKFAELDYIIKDGMIYIASKELLRGKIETRIFDVRDLIIPVVSFPLIETDSREDGLGGMVAFEEVPEDTPTPESIEAILRSIQSEDGWGEGTDVQIQNGLLIVTNYKNILDEAEKVLDKLRKRLLVYIDVKCRFVYLEKSYAEKLIVKLEKNNYKMSTAELKEIELMILNKKDAKDAVLQVISFMNTQRISQQKIKRHKYLSPTFGNDGERTDDEDELFYGTSIDLRGTLSSRNTAILFEIRNSMSYMTSEQYKRGNEIIKLPNVKKHVWRTTMKINKGETGVLVSEGDIKDDDKEWVLFHLLTPTWDDKKDMNQEK